MLSAKIVARLIEQAAARGVDGSTLRELHRLTGMNPLHSDAGERVSIAGYFALWNALASSLDDPGVAIELAQAIAIEDYQLLGFLVMTSATGIAAARNLSAYLRLLTEGGEWSLATGDDVLMARWRRTVPASGGANEFAVAQLVHILRQLRQKRLVPLAVSFRHAAPASVAAHERFFGCAITWDADADGVDLDPRSLRFVPRLANPDLHAFLCAQADEVLARRREPASLVERIREVIAAELPLGAIPASRVARRLAISERSLRRTLSREQQSFRQIVETVRKDRAIALLAAGDCTVAEVATSLGFSDPSAFSRAFKRWCGHPPSVAHAHGAAAGATKC
jgi:AraC-like DNA-binding protein